MKKGCKFALCYILDGSFHDIVNWFLPTPLVYKFAWNPFCILCAHNEIMLGNQEGFKLQKNPLEKWFSLWMFTNCLYSIDIRPPQFKEILFLLAHHKWQHCLFLVGTVRDEERVVNDIYSYECVCVCVCVCEEWLVAMWLNHLAHNGVVVSSSPIRYTFVSKSCPPNPMQHTQLYGDIVGLCWGWTRPLTVS